MALGREHQTAAVRAALDALLNQGRRGVVLADEVGCGKTFEALGTLALLWAHHQQVGAPIRRVLVLADGALMTKWFNEIEARVDKNAAKGDGRGFQQYVAGDEWAAFREMLGGVTKLESRSSGDEAGKVEAGRRQVPADRVYIAKPRLINDTAGSRLVRYLGQTDWDVVIVDEAHNFTNLNNKRAQVFFPDGTPESRSDGLTGRYVLALTATPFQLLTTELIRLLQIIHADRDDLDSLAVDLPRYERALEGFYAVRHLPPTDDARVRQVARLERLRVADASDSTRAGAVGLETMLRRYMLRNTKSGSMRQYELAEREGEDLRSRPFERLVDFRGLVRSSPLIPLRGTDAWVYMNVRDLIDDTVSKEAETKKPTFVAGDLRQCLSSYEQLRASALVSERPDLPRAAEVAALLDRVTASGHLHPKAAALCGIVDRLLAHELDEIRAGRRQLPGKILVFNTLMKTASALKNALSDTVERRLTPFIEERLRDVGWDGIPAARQTVREALGEELADVRDLMREFANEHTMVDQELLAGTGIELKASEASIVDVMFRRAEEHCLQPLFLLRVAEHIRLTGGQADKESVRFFLMRRVTDRLHESLRRIVDDFLDDTPAEGEAGSDENRDKARREIARLARVLSAPEYVGRFDGRTSEEEREARRECFNRPYAPLVLLVSKVGEEGIDLQSHTKSVLHYDVEWNPARMEQREGRVDREGRKTGGAVQVHFFLLKDTYEERIFHTVMQRSVWFDVLIGSKKKELAKGAEDDVEQAEGFDVGAVETGLLTAEEQGRVMLNLRP